MKFEIAGERITFPDKWSDVTLGQLLAIRSAREITDYGVIAILSGKPIDFWQRVDPEAMVSYVLPYLQWSNEPFAWDELPLPDWYTIETTWTMKRVAKKVYGVPGNLDSESYAQKVFIESLLTRQMPESERIPLVLAAYFEPLYYNVPFSTDRLADFVPVILKTSCVEALPIYSFFYGKFSASMRITQNVSVPNTMRMQLSRTRRK